MPSPRTAALLAWSPRETDAATLLRDPVSRMRLTSSHATSPCGSPEDPGVRRALRGPFRDLGQFPGQETLCGERGTDMDVELGTQQASPGHQELREERSPSGSWVSRRRRQGSGTREQRRALLPGRESLPLITAVRRRGRGLSRLVLVRVGGPPSAAGWGWPEPSRVSGVTRTPTRARSCAAGASQGPDADPLSDLVLWARPAAQENRVSGLFFPGPLQQYLNF